MRIPTVFLLVLFLGTGARATEFAITMDDPNLLEPNPLPSPDEDTRIRAALREHAHQAALFVCGMRVNSPAGRKLLKAWDDEGHLIGNHSFTHQYFHSTKVSLDDFVADMEKAERLLTPLKHFAKLFRFPFLKEGDTLEKRDGMRKALEARGYRNGFVSVDASDWYISARLEKRLAQDPKADISGYRNFYLEHMGERAQFYDGLARKLLGREIRHTILVHHNTLNALYLGDLITMLKAKGWKLVPAKQAFADPIYASQPAILPAGESVLWALAKESGKFESELRYPGEDGEYERERMDKLGL